MCAGVPAAPGPTLLPAHLHSPLADHPGLPGPVRVDGQLGPAGGRPAGEPQEHAARHGHQRQEPLLYRSEKVVFFNILSSGAVVQAGYGKILILFENFTGQYRYLTSKIICSPTF